MNISLNLAMLGRGLHFAGQFFLLFFLPLVLTVEDYAKINLLIPAGQIIYSIMAGWITGSVFRWIWRIVENKDGMRDTVIALWMTLFLIMLAAATGCLLAGYVLPSLAIFFALNFALKDIPQKLLNATESHLRFCIFNALLLVLRGVAVALIYQAEDSGYQQAAVILLISEALPALVACYWLARSDMRIIGVKYQRAHLAELFRYGMPLIVSSFGGMAISLANRYILAIYDTAFEVGKFVLAYQLGSNLIAIPVSVYMAAYFPRMLRIERQHGIAEANRGNHRTLKKFLILIPVATIGLTLFSWGICELFYQKYQIPADLIFYIVAAQVIFVSTNFLNKPMELTGQTAMIAKIMGVAAVVAVLGSFLLIPAWGVYGAAWATLLAYAIATLMTYSKYRIYVRQVS